MKIANDFQRPNSLANKRRQLPRSQSFKSSSDSDSPAADKFGMINPMGQRSLTPTPTKDSYTKPRGSGGGGKILMKPRSVYSTSQDDSAVAVSSYHVDESLRLMKLQKNKQSSPRSTSPRPTYLDMHSEAENSPSIPTEIDKYYSPKIDMSLSVTRGIDDDEHAFGVGRIEEIDTVYETDSDDTDAAGETEIALHVEIGDSKAEWLQYIHESFNDSIRRASVEGLELEFTGDAKAFNHDGTTSRKENDNERRRSSSFYRISTELDEVSGLTDHAAESSTSTTASDGKAMKLSPRGRNDAELDLKYNEYRMSEPGGDERRSDVMEMRASDPGVGMDRFRSNTVRYGDIYQGSVIDQEQTLMEAALTNDYETIKHLITESPYLLDVVNEEDQTALHLACKASSIETITLLGRASNESQINAVDKLGRNAFHLCKVGESVTALGESNLFANVNQMDYGGYTPLMFFVRVANASCVAAVMQQGGSPVIAGPDYNQNALHLAADLANFEVIHAILSEAYDMNFDMPDDSFHGDTSPILLGANKSERRSSMMMMRRSSADYDVNLCRKICASEDEYGNTPLHLAASSEKDSGQQLQSIIALLNAGSDVNAKNSREVSALHFICANVALRGFVEPLLEMMLSLGVDVNATDIDGCTPLVVACCYREYSICSLLLQAGGDLNVPCHVDSPFMRADSLKIARRSREKPKDRASEVLEYSPLKQAKNTTKMTTALNTDEMANDAYCTASDLMAKTPRLYLFRFISVMQTRIPGNARQRCMNCASHMGGSESSSFWAQLGLSSGRHHCRHCNRVVCSDCSSKDLPRDMMPDFITAVSDESRMRVCNVCHVVLTERAES